jgi:hypothetical protein
MYKYLENLLKLCLSYRESHTVFSALWFEAMNTIGAFVIFLTDSYACSKNRVDTLTRGFNQSKISYCGGLWYNNTCFGKEKNDRS